MAESPLVTRLKAVQATQATATQAGNTQQAAPRRAPQRAVLPPKEESRENQRLRTKLARTWKKDISALQKLHTEVSASCLIEKNRDEILGEIERKLEESVEGKVAFLEGKISQRNMAAGVIAQLIETIKDSNIPKEKKPPLLTAAHQRGFELLLKRAGSKQDRLDELEQDLNGTDINVFSDEDKTPFRAEIEKRRIENEVEKVRVASEAKAAQRRIDNAVLLTSADKEPLKKRLNAFLPASRWSCVSYWVMCVICFFSVNIAHVVARSVMGSRPRFVLANIPYPDPFLPNSSWYTIALFVLLALSLIGGYVKNADAPFLRRFNWQRVVTGWWPIKVLWILLWVFSFVWSTNEALQNADWRF